MPRSARNVEPTIPTLDQALNALTVEQLKWYIGALPTAPAGRKADLVGLIAGYLKDAQQIRQLWQKLSPDQQGVIADVIHRLDGRYDPEVLEARYPDVAAPQSPNQYAYYSFG